jgi:hypothetical protein
LRSVEKRQVASWFVTIEAIGKKRYILGIYGENSMACVQVDFIQALLPEFLKKSNSGIIDILGKIKTNAALY